MTHNQFLMRDYNFQGLPTTAKEQNLCQGWVAPCESKFEQPPSPPDYLYQALTMWSTDPEGGKRVRGLSSVTCLPPELECPAHRPRGKVKGKFFDARTWATPQAPGVHTG